MSTAAELVARLQACSAPADLIADVIKLAHDAESLQKRRATDAARARKAKASREIALDNVRSDVSRDAQHPSPSSLTLLPREEKKEVRSLRSLTVRDERETLFLRFWTAYPKRPGNPKEPARKAFFRLSAEGEDAEEIIRAAQLLATAMAQAEPRYIPHAATWLNQKRYRDEPPVPQAETRKSNVLSEASDAVIRAAEDADRRSRYSDGEAGQVLDWPIQRLPGFR